MIEKCVFIPSKAPSQNEFMGRHWAMYKKNHRDPWKLKLLMLGSSEHQNKKRYCEITLYHEDYGFFYDNANLVGGCKPIVDGCKDLGWIKDDSDKWFSCKYFQKLVGDDGTREEGTTIKFYKPGTSCCKYLCADCFGVDNDANLEIQERIPPD